MLDFVKQLRSKTGLSQQELADAAKTSQPTIAAYESESKSPNLSTLKRLANSVGLEAFITFVPTLTREDRRSLFYHQEIAKILSKDFENSIKHAKNNLSKMIKKHPHAKELFQLWKKWLNSPKEELLNRILDPGMLARDMRQVSPFAGLLSPQDRMRILKKFRKDHSS